MYNKKLVNVNDFCFLLDIDECDFKFCVNGICFDFVNDFSCNCIFGFIGKCCDIGMWVNWVLLLLCRL